MPVYIWYCKTCKVQTETCQSLGDRSIPRCETCKKPLLRIYTPLPFIFRKDGTGARKDG